MIRGYLERAATLRGKKKEKEKERKRKSKQRLTRNFLTFCKHDRYCIPPKSCGSRDFFASMQ